MWPVYTPTISGELTPAATNRRDTDAIVKPIVGFFRNYSLADSTVREFGLNKSPFHLTPEEFLDENVDVQLDQKTKLINFEVELTDPALAWEVVNYMAREGIKRYTELVQKNFIRNREYLSSQLDKNRIQLKKEGEAFIAFQQKAKMTSLTDRQYFLQTQSDELDGMIVQAGIKLAAKEAKILALEDAIKGNNQSLKSQASMSREKITTEEPASPNDALDSLRLLSDGLNNIFENTEVRLIRNKAEYASLKAGREKMEKSQGETQAELALIEEKLASLSVEEEKLQRKLEVANQMYELTELELAKSKGAAEMLVQQIAIIDNGGVPKKPIGPRVLLMTALTGAAAFLFFIFLSFIIEEVLRRRQS